MSRTDENKKIFKSFFFVIYALGNGLLCLSKQKDNSTIETLISLDKFPKEMKDDLKILLIVFAYAGTKCFKSSKIIAKKEEVNPKVQSMIGSSLIAIGKDVGSEMLICSFGQFFQIGRYSYKKNRCISNFFIKMFKPKSNNNR